MPLDPNQPFEIIIQNGICQLHIKKGSVSRSANRVVDVSRAYILGKFNWNGIVKLMQFVYQKHGEEYQIPDQLDGTEKDNILLLPEKGISYIFSLQLKNALKSIPFTNANLDRILRQADGKPGKGFFSNILKKDRLTFLNESFNKAQKDSDTGSKLIPPSSGASEEVFYQFFKKIVRLRNGLWSNKTGIVNLVGLRRVLFSNDDTDAGYNDTIASCWLDKNGKQRCELNIATTEPGNRNRSRQLYPQTITVIPGFHNKRQPAGRTQNALKEGSNAAIQNRKINDEKPQWNSGDTTMNFHQGGNNFLYPVPPGLTAANAKRARRVWLARFGLKDEMQLGTPTLFMDTDKLFQLNLILSEIYLILSRYGEDGTRAPYKNLSNMLGNPPIFKSGINNGIVKVTQQGQQERFIDIARVKDRTVRIWFDKRRNEATRKKIYEIIEYVSDYSKEEIATWRNFTIPQVIAKIKDEHILKIIDIQMQYLPKISQGVDGIAGNDFYSMISGIWQNIPDAINDKARIDKLLEQLDDMPLKKSIKNMFKKSMTIRTFNNRRNVRDKTKHIASKDLDVVDNVVVGNYSAGCQVFYDTEVFYNFWTKLLKRGEQSGQRRWYYTLIDATNFKKSDVII